MNWWQRLWRRRELDDQLDKELRFHLEERAAELVRGGMHAGEAQRRALLEFGRPDGVKEACRDERGVAWVEDLAKDAAFAARQLRQAPAFAAVAVASLALGIGANTAVFTTIESAIMRPIPVNNAEGLRLLTWREQWGGWVAPNVGGASPAFGWGYEQRITPDNGLIHSGFPPPFYRQFVQASTSFQELFGFRELGRVTALVNGIAEPVNCFLVSSRFYPGLGVAPQAGRAMEHDTAREVLISDEYWARRFGRSPGALGQTLVLNGVPMRIVGVNPAYFTGIEPGARFEIWAPLGLPKEVSGHAVLDEPGYWSVGMMGRLKPGVTDARAQSELDALFQAKVDATYGAGPFGALLKDRGKRPRLLLKTAERGVDYLTQHYDRPLYALMALAALILLIGCANVANLMLAKGAVRQRELSLRLALGAGRWRIARQLLTEGLLLAAIAGVVGLGLGYVARNGLPWLLKTPWRPSPFETAMNWKIGALAAGLTLLAAVLFSLAPVWQVRRPELNEALKEGGKASAGLPKQRLARGLVMLQVVLSVLLVAGAGLFVRTFVNLRNMPLGVKPEGVVVFTVEPPRLFYPEESLGALLRQLTDRLAAVPGVREATLLGPRSVTLVTTAEWKNDRSPESYGWRADVGPRFFETMGIPILHGRAIVAADSRPGPPMVVVNRRFAQHFFQTENPVGRTFTGAEGEPYTVVGVSGDWHVDELREPVHTWFYGPLLTKPKAGPVTFHVKTAGNTAAVVQRMQAAVRAVDANLVMADVRTLQQQIADALREERLLASLGITFAGLAVVLAAIGIYGVMAYAVTRRTNEIGIRVALGAQSSRVAWMVLRETLAMVAVGAGLGVAVVWGLGPAANRLMAPGWYESFGYGAGATDPSMTAAVVGLLVAVALAAGYWPARRAARVDPMVALRHE